jgi:hypothetical protein
VQILKMYSKNTSDYWNTFPSPANGTISRIIYFIWQYNNCCICFVNLCNKLQFIPRTKELLKDVWIGHHNGLKILQYIYWIYKNKQKKKEKRPNMFPHLFLNWVVPLFQLNAYTFSYMWLYFMFIIYKTPKIIVKTHPIIVIHFHILHIYI